MRWAERANTTDADYIAIRRKLMDLGYTFLTREDERYWTKQSRSLLQREGTSLPTCDLDPDGRHCDQKDHGQCPATCRVAVGRHRADILLAGHEHLDAIQGPFLFSTLIEPSWARRTGQLSTFDLRKARQLVRQRFFRLGVTDYAGFGMFEVDHNISKAGRSEWTPHLHLVTAGLPKTLVKEALSPKGDVPRRAAKKPLVVKEIEPSELGKVLSYSTKHFASQRVTTVQQPLPQKLQLEYEHFAAQHRVTDMILLLRLRRYRTKLVALSL